MSLQASNEDQPEQEWSREKKIQFIIDGVKEFEEVTVSPAYFDDWSDQKVNEEFEFYDYLWDK